MVLEPNCSNSFSEFDIFRFLSQALYNTILDLCWTFFWAKIGLLDIFLQFLGTYRFLVALFVHSVVNCNAQHNGSGTK